MSNLYIKKYSPLHLWHQKYGARLMLFAGFQMPMQYSSIKREHLAVRSKAGLFDISHMAQIHIFGAKRHILQSALEKVFPIDFSSFLPGESRYSLLLSPDGGILDDVIVSDAGDYFIIVANGIRRDHDSDYLRQNLPRHISVVVYNELAMIALQGPLADKALKQVLYYRPNIHFMHHHELSWIDQDVLLRLFRQGYTGEDGWEISLPNNVVQNMAERLMDTGLVTPCGLGARNSLRLEAGLPLWGHDIDANISPLEAGLKFALAKSRRKKADFIGANSIAKRSILSVRVGLKIESKQPVREGVMLYSGTKIIGRVTSGIISPTLGIPIAMAQINYDYINNNVSIEAEVRNRRLPAKLCSLPFIPVKYYRAKH